MTRGELLERLQQISYSRTVQAVVARTNKLIEDIHLDGVLDVQAPIEIHRSMGLRTAATLAYSNSWQTLQEMIAVRAAKRFHVDASMRAAEDDLRTLIADIAKDGEPLTYSAEIKYYCVQRRIGICLNSQRRNSGKF